MKTTPLKDTMQPSYVRARTSSRAADSFRRQVATLVVLIYGYTAAARAEGELVYDKLNVLRVYMLFRSIREHPSADVIHCDITLYTRVGSCYNRKHCFEINTKQQKRKRAII